MKDTVQDWALSNLNAGRGDACAGQTKARPILALTDTRLILVSPTNFGGALPMGSAMEPLLPEAGQGRGLGWAKKADSARGLPPDL